MLVHISKLLGRMTGIQFSAGLEETEHSPLTKPLCSGSMLLTADEQEQEQLCLPFRYVDLKKGNAL